MSDEPNASDGQREPPFRKTACKYIVLSACAIAVVALVGGFAGTVIGNAWIANGNAPGIAFTEGQDETSVDASDGQSAEEDGPDESATPAYEEAEAAVDGQDAAASEEHVHDWTAVYALRDVPAVTHVEHHDAVYGTETSYETVCNECGAVVTGATREHTVSTGHTGFTPNVPIVNEVVEQAAYDETVVDTPATVQLVHTSDRCSSCGEEQDIEDEVVQTMDGSASQS